MYQILLWLPIQQVLLNQKNENKNTHNIILY